VADLLTRHFAFAGWWKKPDGKIKMGMQRWDSSTEPWRPSGAYEPDMREPSAGRKPATRAEGLQYIYTWFILNRQMIL
jgi:hypothetical protein